jgi:hypothetical protein
MYGGPQPQHGHSPLLGGQSYFIGAQPFSPYHRGVNSRRRGRRPTVEPVIIGRAVNEGADFDKESLNQSVKMFVPTMGPNTGFMQWGARRRRNGGGPGGGCASMPVGTYLYLHAVGASDYVAVPSLTR